MNQESKSRLRQLHALYLGSRVHRIPRTPEMAADQGQTVRERRRALVVPGGNRHRALPVAAKLQGQHGDERKPGQQDGGGAGDRLVRPLALGRQAQLGSALFKRHRERPAHDDPRQALRRRRL